MTPHEYPKLSGCRSSIRRTIPLARRTRKDGWYTPTARACMPHDHLFRCALGTIEAVPGWAVTDGIRARL
ncbi:hypothetical protein GIB67_023530 [Kingdonia uniflora]|uniref:Uncharacterized protein n=1 Tax=Kingdonia uniflora TaxID=39325 RepID=A0A7J7PA04_9MAGN|nr:hypothetical protein GIB67_023530 [Kingdonia uniflora]